MSIGQRSIPILPDRPRMSPIGPHVRRSYPVGRQEFSRAYVQRTFEVTLWLDNPVPEEAQACLDTTLNSPAAGEWISIPLERINDRTFRCRINPEKEGFFAFRARASVDGGRTWVRDAVPLAWVLVDPPQVDGLRLYTLIPTVSGSIADWSAELPRIKAMGFNAVHLLPVTQLDDSQSPYSASELFEVDRGYLIKDAPGDGLTQLEQFVERAKDLGLRLCVDLVLNHVGTHSTMARRAPSWIVPDPASPDGNKRARYWSDGAWRIWDDLVLINYEHPSDWTRAEIWQYMTEYAMFWSNYANYTGGFVRFDNLHASNQEFVKSLARSIDREYPALGTIAEYFTDDVTLLNTVPDYGLNLVLATPWSYKFVPELRKYLRYIHRISDHIRYLMPITSHDSGSPAQEFGMPESTIPRYTASALLGTGATGITQGVEWGAHERINFIGRQPRITSQGEPRFASFIQTINDILARHAAFRCGGNCEFVDNDHNAVIAAFRHCPSTQASGYLVVCNFDIHESQQITCDLAAVLRGEKVTTARDLLSGKEKRFAGTTLELSLPPCSAMVWEVDIAS